MRIARPSAMSVSVASVTAGGIQRANGKGGKRLVRLDGVEFVRRFMLHVLPVGIKRIRHYGVLASGCRSHSHKRARLCRCLCPTRWQCSVRRPSWCAWPTLTLTFARRARWGVCGVAVTEALGTARPGQCFDAQRARTAA